MANFVAPALRALLEGLIDYAGMYPPASLPREIAVENYLRYRETEHAWMLRWLVISSSELSHVPAVLDGRISVLSEEEELRAAAIESRSIVHSTKPVYCEVPIRELDAVRNASCFAKFRSGGINPEVIPSVDELAMFLRACAERRLAFKATAGLHHPVRATHALTYEPDPPRAVMHGFLNVFVAAAFAWHGEREIESVLAETDPSAFRFDEQVHWQSRSLTAAQVRAARQQFAHAFGSCSFVEPVQGLQALGLL